jgi:DNA processing protein
MNTAMESLLTLNAVDGIGSIRLGRLLERFGSAEAVLTAPASVLVEVEGIGPGLAERVATARQRFDPQAELALAEEHGVWIVTLDDETYPTLLRQIHDPPIALYIRGTLMPEDRHAVAVVGSRTATPYGLGVAEQLGRQLASRGLTVVSGMARGIDAAAHQGALSVTGRTIAVLGCGFLGMDNRSQEERSSWISGSGAVVSEFPLAMPPLKHNFPRRNRVIAGLSLGVVVVEAAQQSGALITADCALEQGREVFAVPGPVDAVTSQGTNALIKGGAKLVQTADDVLEELAPHLDGLVGQGAPSRSGGARTLPPDLPEAMRRIYEVLSDRPLHIDLVGTRSGVSAGQAAALLLQMELRGLVKEVAGKRFQRISR